jgi:hypothetical protein
VIEPREVPVSADSTAALLQILGIMSDELLSGGGRPGWDFDRLDELEQRLQSAALHGSPSMALGIDEAALLLDGMAFTEMASVELPWFDMVRWTSDFVTEQLRQHWTDEEWSAFAATG